MNAAQMLTTDLTHKEESTERMMKDALDRISLHQTLEGCVDPLDLQTHLEGKLMNICTGQIAYPDVNVEQAVSIGTSQLQEFEKSWPEGFYERLSKQVITFSSKKKHIVLKGDPVVDPDAIYA